MEDGVEVVLSGIEPYMIEGESSQRSLKEELVTDFGKEDLSASGITGFFVADSRKKYLLSKFPGLVKFCSHILFEHNC
jgi:hypothetical protein